MNCVSSFYKSLTDCFYPVFGSQENFLSLFDSELSPTEPYYVRWSGKNEIIDHDTRKDLKAEGVYDLMFSNPKESDMSDEDWLESAEALLSLEVLNPKVREDMEARVIRVKKQNENKAIALISSKSLEALSVQELEAKTTKLKDVIESNSQTKSIQWDDRVEVTDHHTRADLKKSGVYDNIYCKLKKIKDLTLEEKLERCVDVLSLRINVQSREKLQKVIRNLRLRILNGEE